MIGNEWNLKCFKVCFSKKIWSENDWKWLYETGNGIKSCFFKEIGLKINAHSCMKPENMYMLMILILGRRYISILTGIWNCPSETNFIKLRMLQIGVVTSVLVMEKCSWHHPWCQHALRGYAELSRIQKCCICLIQNK